MNIFDIKQKNRDKIYFYIRKKKMATKQDIAYDLQLSLPTVTQNLEYLVEQGMIGAECKVANKAGGRNPVAYSYISDAKVAIGLDITRHHIKSIIVDLDGNVIKYIYKRQNYRRDDEYLKLLGEAVEEIIESVKLNRSKILGVSIAVPGLVNHEEGYVIQGRVIDNDGMSCEEFSKYISYPTRLIHDSYASGFSEIWMSTEIHNAFYFSLCDSVGGCVLLNDNVYLGDGLYSGEVGHLNLIPDGGQCYCGQKGCLDVYCNAEVLSSHTDCDLNLFFSKLEQGDEEMQKVWDQYLEHLAMAVTDIRMLFGCTVILGGYVGAHMKAYMPLLCEKVDARGPFGESSKSFLIPCENEIESVATGAALFFVDEFLNDISKEVL
ncbi:ROK family transcriptional regulator [Lachnotalea glycerini]|uniref:ROK family transcriptional regulator n=2 Tax=Lachnotalea glycerini TaxID=1763509 RepID=A0A371JH88_9FIRM|nr:ROK family transcriptional regulator [Lachnotalea glycerini]